MIKFNKMSTLIADIFADKKIKYLIFKGLDVRKIALGARCRRFKSCRPDHFFTLFQFGKPLIF